MQIAAAIRAFTERRTYLEPTKVMLDQARQEERKEEEEVEGPVAGNGVNNKL